TSQVRNGKLVAERRDLIISAAIKVFRQKGFHVATTHDIAAVAGITQSNLYNYVRTKDDILYLVCASLMERYNAVMADVLFRFTDPHVRLIESVRAVISVMFSHKEELVLLYNEAHALKRSDRRLILAEVSKFIKRFQDLIDDYEMAHGPTGIASKRLAANLVSFVPAVAALRAWDLANHVDQDEMAAGILNFTLTGLGIPVLLPKSRQSSEMPTGKTKKRKLEQPAAELVLVNSKRKSNSARKLT
ncbi:MAG: TetR/AcrR family transcriptional regulator, partial [Gallionella sp.]|nr:TetR/AcrR family transcriptional regulator [Gallionella sp.]